MSQTLLLLLINACWLTIYMVLVSSIIAALGGIPLGVLLYVTRKGYLLERPWLHHTLAAIVNIVRSIPFIILIIAMTPITRILVGTSIGSTAAIVPLSFSAIPFVARSVESALVKVDKGLIEAALSMGATSRQIIIKVLLPEALAGIIHGMTLTIITLVGYSAMAGAVGGGGLGDIAIRYGYQRFDMTMMFVTIAILVAIVQLAQSLGDWLTHRVNKH
jgi:D-methionine transport system permease protein